MFRELFSSAFCRHYGHLVNPPGIAIEAGFYLAIVFNEILLSLMATQHEHHPKVTSHLKERLLQGCLG